MIGPKLNRSILPGKFQLYCPQDFDVRLSHLHEIGKKDFKTQGKQSCISMVFVSVDELFQYICLNLLIFNKYNLMQYN